VPPHPSPLPNTNQPPTLQPTLNIHVSLVCRSNYLTIFKSGVQLETRNFGTYTFTPHSVYSSVHDAATSPTAPPGGWDYVIVTTKALPDLVDDSETIAPVIRSAKTAIVLIQNGFGIEEPHRARFPNNPIISGVTVVSAELLNPGTVRQNRWTRLSLGPYSDGFGGRTAAAKDLSARGMQRVDELVRLFTDHGKLRDADPHDELALQTVRWHKICINGSMNPCSILCGGLGSADMVADPILRAHLKACMEEVFDAAPAVLGRPLEKVAMPEQILVSTERNKGSKPSMLMDWEAGRPLELEVILGNPVRISRERGAQLPRLESLYALLRSQQRVRDGKKTQTKL
jgi:2-dehydropantoate 2-reductase